VFCPALSLVSLSAALDNCITAWRSLRSFYHSPLIPALPSLLHFLPFLALSVFTAELSALSSLSSSFLACTLSIWFLALSSLSGSLLSLCLACSLSFSRVLSTSSRCITFLRAATCCNKLHYFATLRNTLQHSATPSFFLSLSSLLAAVYCTISIYAGHDVFTCVTWLIYTCVFTLPLPPRHNSLYLNTEKCLHTQPQSHTQTHILRVLKAIRYTHFFFLPQHRKHVFMPEDHDTTCACYACIDAKKVIQDQVRYQLLNRKTHSWCLSAWEHDFFHWPTHSWWRIPSGRRIFAGRFPQMSPIVSGKSADRNFEDKPLYRSLPSCSLLCEHTTNPFLKLRASGCGRKSSCGE